MVNLWQLLAQFLAMADESPLSIRTSPLLWVGYAQLSSPIVLALAEGLANVAGTEDFSELAPLFILRAGMWGEVGDVGDLPSDVLGLAERFRGWATSSCDKQRRKECYHQTAVGTNCPHEGSGFSSYELLNLRDCIIYMKIKCDSILSLQFGTEMTDKLEN